MMFNQNEVKSKLGARGHFKTNSYVASWSSKELKAQSELAISKALLTAEITTKLFNSSNNQTMIKSITTITTTTAASLCSCLLLLICQIDVASSLVNIHRPNTSITSRWRSHNRPMIIPPMKVSEAATDIVEDLVVNISNEEKATITEQSPPQPSTTTKEAWKPPSQTTTPSSSKIFKIQQPQDLLEFVIADERLSVVKVFAS
eukprot:scaffold22552_cov74-Skeletonema_menzelii.AAC.1